MSNLVSIEAAFSLIQVALHLNSDSDADLIIGCLIFRMCLKLPELRFLLDKMKI